jgi:cystathionine beta-lyase
MRKLSTQLIHHPYKPPAGFEALPPAVHKASTVIFPNVHALRSQEWKDKSGYTYGLHGTPTTFTLEERIATIEGGQYCVLAPSGLSAVALVDMAFLKQGDEVLLPDNAYGPGKAFAAGELAGWGISHRYYDAQNPADLAAKLSPTTRLVWLEAPGSITLEYPDIPALVGVVRSANVGRERAMVTALDNTWGAGIAFNAFDLGVDVSMQAHVPHAPGPGRGRQRRRAGAAWSAQHGAALPRSGRHHAPAGHLDGSAVRRQPGLSSCLARLAWARQLAARRCCRGLPVQRGFRRAVQPSADRCVLR